MSSKNLGLKLLTVVIIMTTLVAGCTNTTATVAPSAAPTSSNEQPTLDTVKTEAAQTVIAAITQNAPTATELLPSSTPFPTATEVPSLTPLPPTAVLPTAIPTATFVPWTSTPVYTPTLTTYNCTITDYSPKLTDTPLKTGQDFDGRWVAKNTGTQPWLKVDVDLKYLSGTKFQTKGDIFDTSADTATGASYTAIVDMLAPTTAGTYYATWGLVRSGLTICTLNLTVVVK